MTQSFKILAGAGLALALAALPACAGESSRAGAAGESMAAAGDAKPAPGDGKPGTDAKPAGSSSDSKSSSGPKEKCPYTTQECLNHMASRLKASGWIGIEYEPAENGTILVQKVVPGSPAEKAGVQPNDILFSINGVEIRNENQDALKKIDRRPGQTLHYVVKRNGVPKPVDIVLSPWPADLLAKYIGEHMLEHAEADALAQGPPK